MNSSPHGAYHTEGDIKVDNKLETLFLFHFLNYYDEVLITIDLWFILISGRASSSTLIILPLHKY